MIKLSVFLLSFFFFFALVDDLHSFKQGRKPQDYKQFSLFSCPQPCVNVYSRSLELLELNEDFRCQLCFSEDVLIKLYMRAGGATRMDDSKP